MNIDKKEVCELLKSLLDDDSRDENVSEYFSWASSHPNINVSSIDLKSIGLPCKLYDLRLKSCYKLGGDDAVYDSDAKLRSHLPRGCVLLQDYSRAKSVFRVVLSGLRKFTGALSVDEDVDETCNEEKKNSDNASMNKLANNNYSSARSSLEWESYFSEPSSNTKEVVVMKKQNGEAVHLSCIKLSSLFPDVELETVKFLIIAGSKNNHIAFSHRDQIENLYTEQRFTMAKEFALRLMKDLDSMPEEKAENFLEYLAETQVTAIFEVLNPFHQHIENLTELESARNCFITWSSNRLETLGLPRLSPDKSMEICEYLGWQHLTPYFTVDVDEAEKYKNDARKWYGIEGCVLYYLNENNNAIGLIKHKTNWYIIIRALRQKSRSALSRKRRQGNNFSVSSFIQSFSSRMTELSAWLNLSPDECNKWIDLGAQFLRHICSENGVTLEDLMDAFPYVWKRFLADRNLTDKSIDLKTNLEAPDCFYLNAT